MNDARPAARYRAALDGADPVACEVAARQLARLRSTSDRVATSTSASTPSPWAHVPLADLFAAQGNHVRRRADGLVESGHEPIHGSRSGRCLLINSASGRWFCRSCRRSGDAVTYMAALRGGSHGDASAVLSARYGPPTARRRGRRRVRGVVFEVVIG